MAKQSDQFGDFDNDPRDYAFGVVEQLGNERELLTSCLKWMSFDDIRGMLDANELSPRFFPEEE